MLARVGAAILRLLRLEPVALGAALTAWATAQKWGDLTMAAVGLTIVWIVRMLSTPTIKVEQAKREAEALGYSKALDDVNALAAPPPPPLPARADRPLRIPRKPRTP